MSHKRNLPRFAHDNGHTDLCFSEDGNYIVTCGSEGDVRIWNGFEDEDQKTICVGQIAFCVAQKGDKLYVGSDNNQVQIFTFPDAELDDILTRFTAPVTTIDVSIDGSHIAAGSEDMEIHLVEKTTKNAKHFVGHKAPILHVAIDPKFEFLASSSCDGSVRVWTIDDQKTVKEWPNVIKPSNSFKSSESLCSISWEPKTGRLFAIPVCNEVKLYQRCTWNVVTTLYNAESTKAYTITVWSSCGRYLAASSCGGEISVWNTIVNRLVSSSNDKHSVNITSLRWNPLSEKQQLGYCDATGQLVSVEKCFHDSIQPKLKSNKEISTRNESSELPIDNFDDTNLFNNDEDAEAICLEKIKANYSSVLDDDNGVDNDDLSSMKSFESHRSIAPVVELQPPFQPTSTPIHLQRRFMVFNDVGYVRQTNTEEENVIDVDFHDASNHHAFRIKNLLNHSMGALNSDALVLACDKTDDSSSKLVCRLFKSWDSAKEWNIELPDGENVEAIAVGNKWLAVATSSRFLRILSLSGVQREITSLLGPVVCLNAVNDLLLVVCHAAMGLPGEQNLSFMVYQVKFDLIILVAAQPLPISPKSTLKWAGFSDLDNPCVLDSDGVLKLFGNESGIWKPLCNVDAQVKGFANHHFVIGVNEERQNIRCILCKGSYYPSTTPHPFITEIGWQIPVCEVSTDKSTFEERFWRYNIAKECLKTEDSGLRKEFLGAALKLFAIATKTGHDMRVFELCEFANHRELTDLAVKYASRCHNETLVEKLASLQSSQEMMDIDRIYDHPTRNFSPVKQRNLSAYDYRESDDYGDGCQSQELFSDTRNTLEMNDRDLQQSVSLIAETKKKKTLSEQKREMTGSKKINPFKKASQWDITSNSSQLESQSNRSLFSATPEVNKPEGSGNPSFVVWFESQKESLRKEFPTLDENALVMQGSKKFRQLKQSISKNLTTTSNNNNENAENSIRSDVESNKKRKSTNDDEQVADYVAPKKKSFSKLQDFVFKK